MACSDCCDSRDITLPEGSDGVGISSITLNGSNQFVITYTDNTTTTTSAVTLTSAATTILHNNNTAQTETYVDGAAPSALGTFGYTVPSGTVTTDGSEIRVTAWFKTTTTAIPHPLTGAHNIAYGISVDGAWFSSTALAGTVISTSGILVPETKFTFTLTRLSNTTVAAEFEGRTYYKDRLLSQFSNGDYEVTPAALGAINFTTTGILLAPYAYYADSSAVGTTLDITCTKFMVEHYKK
jgi:hypothetical protein